MANGLVAALDIGSTKVCCFLARLSDGEQPRIVGVGHQVSYGVRSGAVVDMDALEHSVRAAVDGAETIAGERVRSVVLNITTGNPTSDSIKVESPIGDHPVSETDIRKLLSYGRAHYQENVGQSNAGRELLHAIPVDYILDENEGIRDPRGMFGDKLGVAMHLISAAQGPIRNLTAVVNRCQLTLDARVVSPYASGLACLTEDEREMGVTCLDMGGGTTGISVFVGGQLLHVGVVPVGGQHVTNDIARAFSTPTVHAERLKTLYGSVLSSPADDREILDIPLVGEDADGAGNQVPRSMLVQIIQPRLEETFEMVRQHLVAQGLDQLAGRRLVLTGGASQMQGIREMATQVLDKQVRLGHPVGFLGLGENSSGPAFSGCAGLVRYMVVHRSVVSGGKGGSDSRVAEGTSPLGRLGAWIKNNF